MLPSSSQFPFAAPRQDPAGGPEAEAPGVHFTVCLLVVHSRGGRLISQQYANDPPGLELQLTLGVPARFFLSPDFYIGISGGGGRSRCRLNPFQSSIPEANVRGFKKKSQKIFRSWRLGN